MGHARKVARRTARKMPKSLAGRRRCRPDDLTRVIGRTSGSDAEESVEDSVNGERARGIWNATQMQNPIQICVSKRRPTYMRILIENVSVEKETKFVTRRGLGFGWMEQWMSVILVNWLISLRRFCKFWRQQQSAVECFCDS